MGLRRIAVAPASARSLSRLGASTPTIPITGAAVEIRAGQQKGSWIDRLIGVEKYDVAVGSEVRSAHALDASKRYAKLQQRALKHIGVEVGTGPKQALAAAEVLDQAMCRHEATRKTGRMATAPKRDELRMR